MVISLARFTGWSLTELLDLEMDEARAWYVELREQLRAEQPDS